MIFRFPDKPIETTPIAVASFRESDYIAQNKYDGWRIQIQVDGDRLQVFSSSGFHTTPIAPGSSILVSHTLKIQPHIMEQLKQLHDNIKGHGNPRTVIDAEFVGPRGEQPQGIYLFDMLAEGDWLTLEPFAKRWQRCINLQPMIAGLPQIQLAETFENGFLARFNGLKQAWLASKRQIDLCEGIVLKRRNGLMTLDRAKSKKSNAMWKLKYRDIRTEQY